MVIYANRLWQRERKRRYALWDLERLQPGSDQAIHLLAILDEIQQQDRDEPPCFSPMGHRCGRHANSFGDTPSLHLYKARYPLKVYEWQSFVN